MTAATFEDQPHTPGEAAELIRAAMVTRGLLVATPEDAALLTGLPLHLAGTGLKQLSRELAGRLDVTESGALVFRFASLVRAATGASPLVLLWRRLWVRVIEPLLEPATWAIAATLVLALGSALMEGSQHPPFDRTFLEDPAELVGAALTLIGLLLGLPFFGALLLLAVAWKSAALSFGSGAFVSGGLAITLAIAGALVLWVVHRAIFVRLVRGRRLGAALRGFFRGPPAPRPDPLADEARLMGLIRRRSGIVSLGDLAATFGWDLGQTHHELARILVDYHGTLELDDELHLVARFDRLLHHSGASAAAAPAAAPEPARPGPAPRFFGCSRRFAVLVLSLIVLATGLGLLRPDAPAFPGPNAPAIEAIARRPSKLFDRLDDVANDGFGLWPLVLAIGPLAMRSLSHLGRRRAHARRTRLLRMVAFATDPRRPPRWPHGRLDAADLADLASLGGRVAVDGAVDFPDLDTSHAAAARMRLADPASTGAHGRVVFSA